MRTLFGTKLHVILYNQFADRKTGWSQPRRRTAFIWRVVSEMSCQRTALSAKRHAVIPDCRRAGSDWDIWTRCCSIVLSSSVLLSLLLSLSCDIRRLFIISYQRCLMLYGKNNEYSYINVHRLHRFERYLFFTRRLKPHVGGSYITTDAIHVSSAYSCRSLRPTAR